VALTLNILQANETGDEKPLVSHRVTCQVTVGVMLFCECESPGLVCESVCKLRVANAKMTAGDIFKKYHFSRGRPI